MSNFEWSEGKALTDNLLEMGFVDERMAFRKRYLLAEYLDHYLERRDKDKNKDFSIDMEGVCK